ncbi:hypothetical protein WDK74_22045 [Escherichia coli]
MKTTVFVELDEHYKKLRAGEAVIGVQSWMTDEQIGKYVRKNLELAQGATVTVRYDIIPDEAWEDNDSPD